MGQREISHLIDKRKSIEAAMKEHESAGASMSLDDGISYTRTSYKQLSDELKKINGQIARAKGYNPFIQSVRMTGLY